MGDMLTRWAVHTKSAIDTKKLGAKSLMQAPISPATDSNYDWPTLKDIISSQNDAKESPPSSFRKTKNVWKNDEGAIWIPFEDGQLKLRIIIAAHTGFGGHRSWRVTHATIKSHFWWPKQASDVENFVKSCLHCVATASGTIVPRPLGNTLHSSKPNKLLHFDFCHMGSSDKGNTYILILKDDFSGYVWLIPATETTADVTADALISWFASFGVVSNWVSDRGSHFKNMLVKKLREELKSDHHFTLAYCPWSNGTVEVVCRELIRTTRALLSEFQLPRTSWTKVLPVVQSVLNNSILPRLGNRCPLTAFTGLPQDTPLRTIKTNCGKEVTVKSIKNIQEAQHAHVEKLQAALEDIHKHVAETANKKRKSAIQSHNRRTKVYPINFTTGDYVLRGTMQGKSGRKPALKWHGPFRVVECRSEYIFVIEHLVSGKREEAHGRRLRFFRNSSFNVTEELLNHLEYQAGELYLIEEFTGIRRKGTQFEIRVKWRGFPETESDWIKYSSLQQDVPDLINEYINDLARSGTPRERKLAASI